MMEGDVSLALPSWWPPAWAVEIGDLPAHKALLVASGDYAAGITYNGIAAAAASADGGAERLFYEALAMNGAKLGADALGAWATELHAALLAHVPNDPPGPGRGDPWCDELCAFGRHSLVPSLAGRSHRCTWCHQEFPSSRSPVPWPLR